MKSFYSPSKAILRMCYPNHSAIPNQITFSALCTMCRGDNNVESAMVSLTIWLLRDATESHGERYTLQKLSAEYNS